MTRRLTLAVLAAGWLLAGAMPASAHGIGGRLDLPVPIWLFVYGAAVVVVASFVALGVLWKQPRLENGSRGRPLPLQGLFRSPVADGVLRALSVVFFLVVLGAAAAGRDVASQNLAPYVVYIWFWVGLAFVHALLGNWWATISPWDSIARFLGIGERPRRPYPPAWGMWPSALVIFVFVWLELILPEGANPRVLAVAITLYTVITLGGMAVFGREAWGRHAEGFAVYFRLLSMIAPFGRDDDGRAVVRAPLSGLPRLQPRPGLIALVMVVLGSTTFDGYTGTAFWRESTVDLGPVALAVTGTVAMLATILLAAGAYALAMLATSAITQTPWHPLATRFVHSLVPIAFAYVAAHYFSLMILEGQGGVAFLSDPFSLGWDLFGTAGGGIDYSVLTATAIWYVQVGAIVLGHVAGVVLAHDRALAAFPSKIAVRTQYALLAVMVLFTVGGLVILSGG